VSGLRAPHGGPVRIVLAKLGLDGHDRGLKVVARMLRDAGAEVIYLGLRQSTESVVAAAQQEDADLIGISMHNGGHLTLAPRMVEAARAAGVTAPVVVGGIIPDADVDLLRDVGVAVVLTPGTSEADVIAALAAALDETGGD
jgi:methylmalonyl-CoA mutase, C-terminal domain